MPTDNGPLCVEKYCQKWWQEIYKRVFGAVVFIEDCCAESLHWDGGLENLLDAGAIGVKSLSSFENGGPDNRKAVFITRGMDANLDTIKEVIANSKFINCILIITTNSDILSSERNGISLGPSSQHYDNWLEDLVTEWIGRKPCAVEIMYAPIFAVSVTKNLFITPEYGRMYPKFGDQLQCNQTSSVDLHSLPIADKNEVRRLASSLNALLEDMDMKDDIYFMGAFSSIIAGVLDHLPAAAARRKNAVNQVSLILIDRTVDLCSVTSHNSESLLDKMMNILPRFPGHTIDVAVNMSPLCEANAVSVVDDIHLCPGCVSHKAPQCVQILDHFMNKTQPEVMLGLYDKLSKVNATPTRLPPRVTPQNLEKLVATLKGKYDVIDNNSGVLQQSLAIIQTLKSKEVPQIDLLNCLEKQVLQNITTSRDSTSILAQISNIIKTRAQRGLSLERLLALLVHIYSLAGCDVSFSEAQEVNLHNSLKTALFEDHDKILLNYEDSEHILTPEGSSTLAHKIINRLKDVALIRQMYIRYKTLTKCMDEISPSECRGVLQELMYDLIDADKPDIPDLKCRKEGLKDILKTGFNMLMKSSSKKSMNTMYKHPMQNQYVIIFVVGGITGEECSKMHKALITSGVDNMLLIGSTAIVNPIEAMRQALLLS